MPSLRCAPRALACGVGLAGALLVSGCPVDPRDLVESDGKSAAGSTHGAPGRGSGGAPGTAGGEIGIAGGEAGDAGSGGTAGQENPPTSEGGESGSGGGPEEVDGCADLDRNKVADCYETLVKNASFSAGKEGWKAESDVVDAWKSRAADRDGLLSVENSRVADLAALSMGGSAQCVPAKGDLTYAVFARLFIRDGQGSGMGGVGLLFYDSTDCSGNPTYGFTSTLLANVGEWGVAEGNGQAPSGTRSMSVRLVSIKPFRQNALDVYFDDVLLRRF